MIVFITAHDEPTKDNLVVAGHLAAGAGFALCEADAVRANVINALEAAPAVPFLALAHGRPDQIRGHDGQPAISIADVDLLSSRENFALACYTATTLGPGVAAAGGTWFGYAGPVNCLPADVDTRKHFVAIADFVADRFPGCTTQESAEAFIEDLDTLTSEAFFEIESSDLETFEPLHALRDLTRRLRIWLPGAMVAVKHAEAVGDPII